MERRLAAILVADVVGYARLIRVDEEGTIAALKALRADLIDPKLGEHNGRIVKLMGDGMLADFPSVVDAVCAAVETQQAVAKHNSDLLKDKGIDFLVGVNLGHVVLDDTATPAEFRKVGGPLHDRTTFEQCLTSGEPESCLTPVSCS